ncbi:MAG: hypothetical protein K6G19_09365, partial [Lachnospiraceae bacterium]|nr:hypothetical protein [Lachnospiraceae bacterium]
SLDANNEGDTAFPTFLKARHAADSISIRNQIYKDNLKKQAEKGKNAGTSGPGWWKTAMLNNVDRLKFVYNGVGGVIDRTIGIGAMIASNTLILGGKIVKLPLKLLSMAFNKISKKCKSKKRWTVDYSITKGWAGLSESRQIFRDCAKGLVALPVGVYDSIVHGFPYLFRKMTGSIKKTDKVYRTSGKLFKGIGDRIFGIMRGLGFTKQYPDLSEIDEASLLDKTVMDAAEKLDETLHKEYKEKEKEGKENSKAKKIRENQQELEGLFDELDEKEENKEKEENEKKEDEKKEDEKKEDNEKKEDEKRDEEKHDEKNEENDKEQEKNEEKEKEKEENKEKEEKKEEHYSSPEERLEKMKINPDTIREFKAVYNAEAKAYHEQELKKFKKKIPKDKASAEKLVNIQKGWFTDSKGLEKLDWLPEISEELKKHLNWLVKYYTVNDPTLDTNRKGVLKRLEMGNYNVSMEDPGMDEAYEDQGTNNCYACSATAMLNQYIAHHKNKNKNEKEKVERLYNQYNFREYKPNVRLYDPKFDGILDKLGYDRNVKHIGQYAGKGKRDVGSVFVLGDFILDKLEKNGIKDAMLNRMVFTLPEENSKDTKETKERNETKINNMRAVFAEKIAGIVGSGGVASVLVDHGHYAHYITITGINGNDVEVYDSYGYTGNKKTRQISDILKAGWYVELNWISEKKKPEELTKEFKRLKYDEKDGYSVDYTSHNQVAESITHTKGVTVVKDDVEMGEEYEDIAHMAYIPDEKKIESLPLKDYLKAIDKKGKKKTEDKTILRDKGWVVFSDAEESQEYTEEEFKEKIEEKKAEDEEDKEKNTDEKK